MYVFVGAKRGCVASILPEYYLLQGTSASSWLLAGHVVVSSYKTLTHRRVNIWPSAREKGRWRTRWNGEIRSLYKDLNIVDDIQIGTLVWVGHFVRMEDERIPEKVLNGKYHNKRSIG
jgi:hypothetical protein